MHTQPLFLARSLCQDACSRPLPPPACGLAIHISSARVSGPLSVIAALCEEPADNVRMSVVADMHAVGPGAGYRTTDRLLVASRRSLCPCQQRFCMCQQLMAQNRALRCSP